MVRGYSMIFEDTNIEDSVIPFACIATDLVSGSPKALTRGSIIQNVTASCSIPGIVEPTVHELGTLVDGDVTSLTPVLEARELGAQTVLAVDVSEEPSIPKAPARGIEIALRAGDVASAHMNVHAIQHAEFTIFPPVKSIHWSRFDLLEELIQSGDQETQKQMGTIRSILRSP